MTSLPSRRRTLQQLAGLTLIPVIAPAAAHGGAEASAASSLSLAFPVAVLSVAPAVTPICLLTLSSAQAAENTQPA